MFVCVIYLVPILNLLALLLGPKRKELSYILPALCLFTFTRVQSLQVGYASQFLISETLAVVEAVLTRSLCILVHYLMCFMFEGCADDFCYTNQGQNPTIGGVDDAKELRNTRRAFSLLGELVSCTLKKLYCTCFDLMLIHVNLKLY